MQIHYFQKEDMVSFGQYLLSEERRELFKSHPELGETNLEERLAEVTDADIENWLAKQTVTLSM